MESAGEIILLSLLGGVLEKAHVPLFRRGLSWFEAERCFSQLLPAGAVVNNCLVPLRYFVSKSLKAKSAGGLTEKGFFGGVQVFSSVILAQ